MVAVAIMLDALAYKRRESNNPTSTRGVFLSIVSGVLMGIFYPFVAKSTLGDHALGPYAAGFIFAIGVALCSLPLNSFLMKHSLTGEPSTSFTQYLKTKSSWHFWALLGGMIWCTGAVSSFVASKANLVGSAVSYAIGQGATMVSAVWESSSGASLRQPQGGPQVDPVDVPVFLDWPGGDCCRSAPC